MASSREVAELSKEEPPEWYDRTVRNFWFINVVLLISVIAYVSNRLHFGPTTPFRSPWWPWASCFDDVCPVNQCCSQFLLDEYSFTHYNHGFYLFPLVFTMNLRKWAYTRGGKACDPTSFDWLGFHVSLFLELLWEGGENTEYIINKFRDTSAPEYEGDSGANILGDVLVCMTGYVAIEATLNHSFRRFGWKLYFAAMVGHLVLIEGFFFAWVCDGLFIIWVNLSGIAVISLCGPNHYYLYLALSILLVLAGWALPYKLAQSSKENDEAAAKEGASTELVP